MPAYRVENVVDTTGAGDSWSAGFLAGLHDGLDLPADVLDKIYSTNAIKLVPLDA